MSAPTLTKADARLVAAALEQEAENYRDGDKYQPRGKTLHALAKKVRTALRKAGAL